MRKCITCGNSIKCYTKAQNGKDLCYDDDYDGEMFCSNYFSRFDNSCAQWLISGDGYYPYCSRCGAEVVGHRLNNFCSNCGADMRRSLI